MRLCLKIVWSWRITFFKVKAYWIGIAQRNLDIRINRKDLLIPPWTVFLWFEWRIVRTWTNSQPRTRRGIFELSLSFVFSLLRQLVFPVAPYRAKALSFWRYWMQAACFHISLYRCAITSQPLKYRDVRAFPGAPHSMNWPMALLRHTLMFAIFDFKVRWIT